MASELSSRPLRKLAAIMAADVVGYSRLMEANEAATLAAVRNVISSCIAPRAHVHGGRIVKTMGDGVLLEFASAVEAVACALSIARYVDDQSVCSGESTKLQFRTGINLGDVIDEDGDIFGDGVNIAARLQSIADPGSIFVSDDVYRQVIGKVDTDFQDLGEQGLKNISRRVRVYRAISRRKSVSLGGTIPTMQHDSRLSVAVLPLANMSGDPEQEYFSDGITEDIITDLSKVSGLFVIARNSTFVYKGRAVNIPQVGRELGARYVAEGSVRKVANRVRITVQLIDSRTGGHVWADRFDRELTDIFAVQDEVAREIVSALRVQLQPAEERRIEAVGTRHIEAYDLVLRGRELLYRVRPESNDRAARLASRAVEIDSAFGPAHALLAFTYLLKWNLGWHPVPEASLDPAFECAARAVECDPAGAPAHCVLGNVYLWKRQHALAIAEFERAISLDPNYAEGLAFFGFALAWAGQPEKGIERLKLAMKLDPAHPPFYMYCLGMAYYAAGRLQDALMMLRRSATRDPAFMPTHGFLSIVLARLGLMDEAREQVDEAVRLVPILTSDILPGFLPYADSAQVTTDVELMKKAGLK